MRDPLQDEIKHYECKFTVKFTIAVAPPQTLDEAMHYLRRDLVMAVLQMGTQNVSMTIEGEPHEQFVPSAS